MYRLLTTIFALSLSTLAWGQEFTLWGDTDSDGEPDLWQLEAVAGTYYENGLGKPTVAWDGSQWVLYFETWVDPDSWPDDLAAWEPTDFASCPGGKPVWLVGSATSADGLSWTVGDPVLMPAANTYYACQAAHPTVVYDGSTWHMWFKAQQVGTECDDGEEPEWGCSQYTAMGYATSSDGTSYTIHDPAVLFSDWIEEYSSFGYPSVAAYSPTGTSEFEWLMLVSRIKTTSQTSDDPDGRSGDIMAALASDPGGPWTTEPDPAFEAGFLPWISDRVYSPAVVCEDEGYPYSMFFGGKQKVEEGDMRGLGLAVGEEWDDWLLDAANNPIYEWPKGENWTGWDAVRVGEEYLVWYAEKDENKNNRLNLAYSPATTTWDTASISNRICDIFIDNDGDGFEPPEDCNDGNDSIYPGADELCNDVDDDCDDLVDEELDCDEDGYPVEEDCGPDDYQDDDPLVNPGAPELCDNGIDDNCDGEVDEEPCFIDADGDGYGAGDEDDEDCDDTDPDINPGMDEDCENGIDDNCDGLIDEEDLDACEPVDTGGGGGCCEDDGTNGEAAAIPALLLLPMVLGLRRRRRR